MTVNKPEGSEPPIIYLAQRRRSVSVQGIGRLESHCHAPDNVRYPFSYRTHRSADRPGQRPHSIPAILLARLALDRRLHGQGLGASLLLDALTRATDAMQIAGGRLIVVDAIDEPARRFYEHHGFHAAPTRPARLFRNAAEVTAAQRAG